MVSIRRASVADAVKVAPRLRTADREECQAHLGLPPETILPLTTATSETWAMVDATGEPFGLFGASPVAAHPYFGIVWMCSTNEIFKHKKQLLRESKPVLDALHGTFDLLGNHVDARNETHIRWLEWLGFSFLRVIPEFGVERRPFIEFARLRTSPCA